MKNNILAKLNNLAKKNVLKDGKLEFNLFKARILTTMDYSGSEAELTALKEAVKEFIEIDDDLDKKYLSDIVDSDFRILYLSQNEKTGSNTLNLNISPAWTCYESYHGHCTVQSPTRDENFSKTGAKQLCYALAQENTYKLKMIYGVCNYITMHQISKDEAVKQVLSALESLNCDYLRFNEFGSFFGNESFEFCDYIAREVSDKAIAYSYTSNIELFIKYYNNSKMTLNLSNKVIPNLKGYKRTIIVQPSIQNFKKYMESPNHVVCCGDCSNCSYCKDKDDLRVIVFFDHGHGVKLRIFHSDHPNEPEYCILDSNGHKEFLRMVREENDQFLRRMGRTTSLKSIFNHILD